MLALNLPCLAGAASPTSHIPPSCLVRMCRYVWAACSARPTNAHNAVAKFDTHEKSMQVRAGWVNRAGLLAGTLPPCLSACVPVGWGVAVL